MQVEWKVRLCWMPENKKPPTQKPVIVVFIENGKQRWARAAWVPKFMVEDTNYEGESDYNEADDTYYWPEGWYEWNHAEEIHWMLIEDITHWAEIVLPNVD